MRADTADPVLPFNLGNVFQAQGRATEAKVAWQIAVARDPAFAEAWYNLAQAAEDEQQTDLAVAQYRRAVQAEPGYADAHFNLALLLTKLDRCSRGARRLGTLPRARTVIAADRHGAKGDRALPHEDPAGTGAGGVRSGNVPRHTAEVPPTAGGGEGCRRAICSLDLNSTDCQRSTEASPSALRAPPSADGAGREMTTSLSE